MTAYVTYEFYTDEYHGTGVAVSDFLRLSEEASATIDYLTYDRSSDIITTGDETTLIGKIKLAVCAVIDVLNDIKMNGAGITSEAVSSYRVSYAGASEKQAPRDVRCMRAAKRYLGHTGLMYKGLETFDALEF